LGFIENLGFYLYINVYSHFWLENFCAILWHFLPPLSPRCPQGFESLLAQGVKSDLRILDYL